MIQEGEGGSENTQVETLAFITYSLKWHSITSALFYLIDWLSKSTLKQREIKFYLLNEGGGRSIKEFMGIDLKLSHEIIMDGILAVLDSVLGFGALTGSPISWQF